MWINRSGGIALISTILLSGCMSHIATKSDVEQSYHATDELQLGIDTAQAFLQYKSYPIDDRYKKLFGGETIRYVRFLGPKLWSLTGIASFGYDTLGKIRTFEWSTPLIDTLHPDVIHAAYADLDERYGKRYRQKEGLVEWQTARESITLDVIDSSKISLEKHFLH